MTSYSDRDVWRQSVSWTKMTTTHHDLAAMEKLLRESGPPLYPTAKQQAAIEILLNRPKDNNNDNAN